MLEGGLEKVLWKYCIIALSLTQIFIVMMCSHISPLFCSPLAEEWRNCVEETIYHWRWWVSCQSICLKHLKWPLTFLLHMTWMTFDLWFSTWPEWPLTFPLHMAWMTFDLSFSTWQCVITGTRSVTCQDHSTTPATKVQPNASSILPHLETIKQPLSWLLGKWKEVIHFMNGCL